MTDFRNFKGKAKPIEDTDLPRIGAQIGVGEDELHAFMDVESAGRAYDSQGRPVILFEPHVFYRNLTSPERDLAIQRGLAYKNWGEKPYPKDSYPRLIEAIKINETAALKSASWGSTQVLGENYRACGWSSVQQMVLDMMDDEENCLQATVNFLKFNHLSNALKAHQWATVAKGYNGSGYSKNHYDTKMAEAFARWQKIKDTPWNGTVAAPTPVPQTIPSVPAPVQPPVVETPVQPSMTPVEPMPTKTGPAPKLTFMDVIVLIFRSIFGGIK